MSHPEHRPRLLSAEYLLGTWTGRLICVNFAVFVYLSIASGSLMMPDTQVLLALGAKDPVGLASGEFWRFFTPVFIHIGIIHFAVNNFMLHVIGSQLERMIGGPWYLGIYLASGIAGNIASAVFSVHLSAGASGAIFGLLGIGFFLETSIGRRIREVTGRQPQGRAYAMTVVLNLAFGFMVPFIDNSAHLGGLVVGAGLTFAMVHLRRNRLMQINRPLGYGIISGFLLLAGVGSALALSPSYHIQRLTEAGDNATAAQERYLMYTQAIDIDPSRAELRIRRARLLLFERDIKGGFEDLREILEGPLRDDERLALNRLVEDLQQSGLVLEASQLKSLLVHAGL